MNWALNPTQLRMGRPSPLHRAMRLKDTGSGCELPKGQSGCLLGGGGSVIRGIHHTFSYFNLNIKGNLRSAGKEISGAALQVEAQQLKDPESLSALSKSS